MFKKVLSVTIGLCLVASIASAVQLSLDGTNVGHFSKLNVTRAASTAISGQTATIDLSAFAQSSTSGAVEVIGLTQSDVDQAFIKFTCTEGDLNCVSTYTSTLASKKGAIRVDINGTTRWIQYYNDPN